jgi:hypothetical protein
MGMLAVSRPFSSALAASAIIKRWEEGVYQTSAAPRLEDGCSQAWVPQISAPCPTAFVVRRCENPISGRSDFGSKSTGRGFAKKAITSNSTMTLRVEFDSLK